MTWINFFFFLAEKIKRISLIRDKTNVIKNYLNEIKEEDTSISIPNVQEEELQIMTTPPIKPPKSLPTTLTQQSLLSAALKTPTEEALAFIEKAKIQIKKQNSLINNETTTAQMQNSPNNDQQLNKQNNEKIQNLLTELSLDEPPFEDANEYDEVPQINNNESGRIV